MSREEFEPEIRALGRRLGRRRLSPARLRRLPHQRGTAMVASDPELRAALFKLVDVAPACAGRADLTRHLNAFLSELGGDDRVRTALQRVSGSAALAPGIGSASIFAINQLARRFIVGTTPAGAVPELTRLWSHGSAASVDLLGEATVTPAEGAEYAARCDRALVTLSRAALGWGTRELLERDSVGPIPRVNLSVKVTALTPLVRPSAPARGRADAERHLRGLLRRARDLGAHLHVDMESLDSREMILDLVLGLLAEDEFREGPSSGLVLQAYLRDSEDVLDYVLGWEEQTDRTVPLTIRLVKGAYWDHEVIDAAQNGWAVPVWESRAECDRSFERVTRRLIDAFPRLRPAIASHNLRSLSHALVYARAAGLGIEDLEIQVLRGLGDELQEALAAVGVRNRTYCPVGDLVSGMAYLVRRLLENTANESFLATQAAGAGLDELLLAP
jgi:proline dehydrogenase